MILANSTRSSGVVVTVLPRPETGLIDRMTRANLSITRSSSAYNTSVSGKEGDNTKKRLYELIDEFSRLERNWNDNNADAVPANVIEKAKDVIAVLDVVPFICPTTEGGIQFEFDEENKDHLECEITCDGRIEYFYSVNGEEEECEIPYSLENFINLVKGFYDNRV